MKPSKTSSRGYSLIELLVSLSLGLLVIGAAVQLFSKGVDATWVVTQRAELQQNARAASTMVTKDISLAGAGLPSGGVALASGNGILRQRYGCDYTGACYLGVLNNTNVTYPQQQPVAGTFINYLYGVIPGWRQGITVNGTQSDVITVVYADTNFLLGDYQVRFNDNNGNSVSFQLPVPQPNPLDQPVNNTGVGLQRGDLVLFTNTAGAAAIAEVTAPVPAGGGPVYTVAFATASPLLFNQNGATSGSLNTTFNLQINPANVGVFLPITNKAVRLWVITYYLDNRTGVPTLMRQVNGRLPVAVAENVTDLRFTYDTYDDSGTLLNALGDGGMTAVPPISPNAIRRINITRFTLRSQMRGAMGYQSMDLQTSISARNMSFIDRYQ